MKNKGRIMEEYQYSLDALESVPCPAEALVNATQSITLAVMLSVFIDIRDILQTIEIKMNP